MTKFNKPRDVNCDGLPPYRLGDAILHGNAAITQLYSSETPYEETIGWKFIHHTITTKKLFDWNHLHQLALKIEHIPAGDDTLVMGLRLGDFKRVTDPQNLDHIIQNVVHSSIKYSAYKVVIVTALVWDPKNSRADKANHNDSNMTALQYLLSGLEAKNLIVDIYSKSPDLDFAYMVTASNLIVGTGNFHLLAGICNKNNVEYSLNTPITLTGPTRGIRRPIKATIQDIIHFYRNNSNLDISKLNLSSIGPGTPLNKRLLNIMSRVC